MRGGEKVKTGRKKIQGREEERRREETVWGGREKGKAGRMRWEEDERLGSGGKAGSGEERGEEVEEVRREDKRDTDEGVDR